MNIETTLNIKNYYFELLVNASIFTGRSKGSIISSLMLRLSRDHDRFSKMWEQIQYQKRVEKGGYHRLHIGLRPGEYELFLDLRKTFKKSVSLLVAQAIDEYLDEMVDSMKNNPDNYPLISYAMNKLIIDDIVNWVFSWGVTAKLMSHPIYCIT